MNKDFALWTVDDEEVVTSGLGPDVSAGDYVSFDYFMTIKNPNNKAFLDRFRAEVRQGRADEHRGGRHVQRRAHGGEGDDKTGKVCTDALREGLKDWLFDRAPQGNVTMREMRQPDGAAILPDAGAARLDRRERHVRGGPALRFGRARWTPAAIAAALITPDRGPHVAAPHARRLTGTGMILGLDVLIDSA